MRGEEGFLDPSRVTDTPDEPQPSVPSTPSQPFLSTGLGETGAIRERHRDILPPPNTKEFQDERAEAMSFLGIFELPVPEDLQDDHEFYRGFNAIFRETRADLGVSSAIATEKSVLIAYRNAVRQAHLHKEIRVLRSDVRTLLPKLDEARRTTEQDYLTPLLNRRGFENRLLEAVLTDRDPFVLLQLDANDVKRVNDTQGYAAGDKLIQDIADVLQRDNRETDHLGRLGEEAHARLGGDEFGVLLQETEGEEIDGYWKRKASLFQARGISIGAGAVVVDPREFYGLSVAEVKEKLEQLKLRATGALKVAKKRSKDEGKPTLVHATDQEAVAEFIKLKVEAQSAAAKHKDAPNVPGSK